MDLDDQVEACRRVFASDTRWTIVRGSELEEGESQGLPVWSRHVGDPILASNITRRVDFALFMVAALENDALIHEAPAIVSTAHGDYLAANALGRALYAPVFDSPEQPANSARFTFLDPVAPDFFPDWDRLSSELVAALRSQAGRDPHDRNLQDLIGELSTRSDEFRVRWAAHNVRFHRTGHKRLHHPIVGELELSYETLTLDVAALERAITPRTKVIVPVHLYGQVAPMEDLQAIATFFETEASALAHARASTGYSLYPVPQHDRDLLFVQHRQAAALAPISSAPGS